MKMYEDRISKVPAPIWLIHILQNKNKKRRKGENCTCLFFLCGFYECFEDADGASLAFSDFFFSFSFFFLFLSQFRSSVDFCGSGFWETLRLRYLMKVVVASSLLSFFYELSADLLEEFCVVFCFFFFFCSLFAYFADEEECHVNYTFQVWD